MLFATNALTRMGTVEDGSTVSDFEDEEIRRNLSLSTAILPVEYQDHKINMLDTPGYTDFIGEVISTLRVADGALVLIDAVAGVEVGTEVVWDYCSEFDLPRFVVINKMNRENASYERALAAVETLPTDATFIPVQLPWGEKLDFKGVIDVLSMKAYGKAGDAPTAIPDEFADQVEEARLQLVEAAAEGDDSLLEKYLEGEELTTEEIQKGLQLAVRSGRFVPVFLAAATDGIGAQALLDAILAVMPSPAEVPPVMAKGPTGEEELECTDTGPLAAYVWKTTADPFVGRLTYFRVYSGVMSGDTKVWNDERHEDERLGTLHVIRGKEQMAVDHLHAGDIGTVAKLTETQTGDTLSDKGHALTLPMPEYPNALFSVAVSPSSQADSAKMGPTLTRLSEEDPTLSWHTEQATNQTILQGMGDQHIDVAVRKAEAKFQTGISTAEPRVPYKETITRAGHAEYRHKKQSGGAGQFAEVHMDIEPLEEEEFEFENKVFGGAISQGYMPAIEKGVKSEMIGGVIAGYPVEKVKVMVVDGKEHPVDSKAIAFEIAGRQAFKQAFRNAGPVLLEPIMDIRVIMPEASMGDVLGDLNTRRARVQGMETEHGRSVVTAKVPLAEIQRYTNDLRSITGGRGVFSMELSHYEVVPTHIAEEIIAQKERQDKEEDEN
jgi:elongation factor G